MPKLNRTLTMRSAENINQFGSENGGPGSLGQLIQVLHNQFQAVVERRAMHDNKIVECRHYNVVGGKHLLHLVAFTPDDQISLVPNAAGDVVEADLRLARAPDGTEFLDGELFLLIAGNDVLVCRSGLAEKALTSYVLRLAQVAGYENEDVVFELLKRADIDKLDLIQRDGVRQVSMKTVAYRTSIEDVVERNKSLRALRSLYGEIQAVFGFEDVEELDQQNLKVEALVTFDKLRGSAVSQRNLVQMAESMIEDEEEGFMIETLSGKKIRASDMVLSKSVRLDQFGKSIHHNTAWGALQEYDRELRRGR